MSVQVASPIVTEVDIPGFDWHSGKVRNSAVVNKNIGLMVFVTTDRISAFDVVLPTPIPLKGLVLHQVSSFWKRYSADIIPNDIVSDDYRRCLPYLGLTENSEWAGKLKGRTYLARLANVIPVECVVRGYISGSLWSAFASHKQAMVIRLPEILVLGHGLPRDLQESQRLPRPIFTPSTKAPAGQHDENLTYEQMINHLELWLMDQPRIERWANVKLLAQALKAVSLLLYIRACEYAERRGIIIADTKFEFGFVGDELVLCDEVLTPDSSRFWPIQNYRVGKSQPSLDKQPLRDWLVASGWNKEPPAPELPRPLVRATIKRYQEIAERFIGKQGGDLL